MRWLSLLSGVLLGCGSAPGLTIDPEPYDVEEVRTTVAEVIQVIEANGYPDFGRTFSTLDVHLSFPAQLDCGRDANAIGCTEYGTIQVVPRYRIVACTALPHEMLHVLVGDSEHELPGIWDSATSLEAQVVHTCYQHRQMGESLFW